jgi:hypothetical protein
MARIVGRHGAVLLALIVSATVSLAEVTVTFDKETLNELLTEVSVSRVEVPLTESHSITVLLEDLEVVALRPAAEGDGEDRIDASVRLRVPQLGMAVPVKPQLSIHVVEADDQSALELRFHRVDLALPLTTIDIAAMLPPVRFPAESVFLLSGAEGDVPIRSRLTGVKMGREKLRLELSVEVVDE